MLSTTARRLGAALAAALAIAIAAPVAAQPGPPPRAATLDEGGPSELTAVGAVGAAELAAALDLPAESIAAASYGASDPRAFGLSTTALAGMPRRGDSFAIISTGLAASAPGANSSGGLSTRLGGLNNARGNDLAQLTLTLRAPADATCLSLDFVYLSEEFPEFVGSSFNDTFTAEIGRSSLQLVGNEVVAPANFAFDAAANVISINTVSGVTPRGTTYDAATAVLTARTPVASGANITLTFSVQDLGDDLYDSAVFLDNARWSSGGGCPAGGELAPPLILVHGFSGLEANDLRCDPSAFQTADIVRYSEVRARPTTAVRYWDAMPAWLADDPARPYDVWVARLQTGRDQGTRSLLGNAGCLADQIAYVHGRNPQPITIVAHSMGGLVSRAALYDPAVSGKVRALYTLGSPHAGVNAGALFYDQEDRCGSTNQTGACNMAPQVMVYFNAAVRNQPGVAYTFIGGDATPSNIFYDDAAPPHDGLVTRESAVGRINGDYLPSGWASASPPRQIWTNETHSGFFGGNTYMSIRPVQYFSQSYFCIAAIERGLAAPAFCRAGASPAQAQSSATPAQRTASVRGRVSPGATAEHSLAIDGGEALVVTLAAERAGLSLTLVRPDGVVVDAAYAAARPQEVARELSPAGAGAPTERYRFLTTQPAGIWTLRVGGGVSGGGYRAQAALRSTLGLEASLDRAAYLPGEPVRVTARLAGATGGATVSAELAGPGGAPVTAALADQGGGVYAGELAAPAAPGPLAVTVTARDGAGGWSREALAAGVVLPGGVALAGEHSLTPRNDNGDQLAEALELRSTVTAAAPGAYTAVATLEAGGVVVAQAAAEVQLRAGRQEVALRFDGSAIRAARRDGPYRVAALQILERGSALPAARAEAVAGLEGRGWATFGGCGRLTVGQVPAAGGRVRAEPAPNCAGGTQYSEGTEVRLTALPARGYRHAAWQGTAAAPGGAATLVVSTGGATVRAVFAPLWRVNLPLLRR